MNGSGHSRLQATVKWSAVAIAVAMSVYQLVTGYPGIGPPIAEAHYPLHLGFALLVLFTTDAAGAIGSRHYWRAVWDGIVSIVTIAAIGYLVVNADYIANRFNFAEPLTGLEMILGVGLIAVILDAARRTVGWVLVALAVAFFVYAYFGDYFPDPFWHHGFSLNRIVELCYVTPEGIWNAPLRIAASYIFLFVLFGALLVSSGAGTFFTDFARGLTGRTTGGPAKTAVVASALMGMLSGSSAANVVTTGSFTIPAMKRVGYRPEFAAGVEAVASTGGQLMPPIMGAAAFLMIEFVGVSYADIIGFAIIPAILYFLAVFVMVDLEARRLGLRHVEGEVLPRISVILRRQGYLVLPIVAMMYFLLEGYTPTAAAFWSIVSLAVLTVIFDRANRRNILKIILEALVEAPRMIAPITVACAIGGIIAGIIVMGGLGLRVSGIILDASGGIVIVALLLTMLAAIVLGMGMPTSAAYIVMAALLAPGLANMGVPLVAAHMFIIYCAAMSGITPPVAISSFAAAAIAGTDPWRTSWIAIKLGLSVYLIPFMFVYGPALLGLGEPWQIALGVVTAIVGITALSIAIVGWFRAPLRSWERLIAFLAAMSMIYSGWRTDLLGVALCLVFLGLVHIRLKRRPLPSTA